MSPMSPGAFQKLLKGLLERDIESHVPNEAGELTPSDYVLLEEVFGLPLLAYLCAKDELSMREWLVDPHDPDRVTAQGRSVVAGWLLPLAKSLSTIPQSQRDWGWAIQAAPFGDGHECWGSALRMQSGGDLVVVDPSADHVKDALVRIAVDAFPVLIAPGSMSWDGPSVSLYRHPARATLLEALRNDPILVALYGQEETWGGRRGYMVNSFGEGRTIQDSGFAEELILASWDMACMGTESPGVTELASLVERNLDRVREAVGGGAPTVPVKLVFTGFKTRDGLAIPTPWGRLRPIHDWERSFVPQELQRSVSGQDDDGKQVLVSLGGEMVLEMLVPYRVEIGSFPGPGFFDDGKFTAAIRRLAPTRSIEFIRDAVSLALAMSVERPPGSWVVSRLAWTWRADPMGRGRGISGWYPTSAGPGFMPYELASHDCEAVQRWCELIELHWTAQLDVAVRRLISASDARMNAADQLVDAVVVWEALFGTRQGESALRISAAMAWLLADDDIEARTLLRSEISRIYSERSGIVHGRAHDEAATQTVANRALELARDALKRLMGDRPDLLARDNAERSVHLLLGG